MSMPKADRKQLIHSLGLSEAEVAIIRDAEKEKVRQGAAKGLLPGSPEQTLKMMTAVAMAAPEEALRDLAVMSGKGLPEATVIDYADKGTCDAILWFIYRTQNENQKVKRKLYVNRHTPVALLTEAARDEKSGDLLELLAGNQAKMGENPEFPGHLIDNPALSAVARVRVEEFFARTFARNLLQKHGYDTPEEPEVDSEAEEVDVADDATTVEDLPEELMERDKADEIKDQPFAKLDLEEEDEEEEASKKKQSLFGAIQTMTTAEKIKLAILGNLEARKILIKESNRLVQESVMKNPRITDPEIAAIAANKQTSADILRIIVKNKGWMRKYSLKVVLVQNGKLPIAEAMRILNQLRDNDLKNIAKSRSVSGAVAKQAKTILQKRG